MQRAMNVQTVPVELNASDLAVLKLLERLGRGAVSEHIKRAVSRYVEQYSPTLADLEHLRFSPDPSRRAVERKPA